MLNSGKMCVMFNGQDKRKSEYYGSLRRIEYKKIRKRDIKNNSTIT